jgi:hypothetical protein
MSGLKCLYTIHFSFSSTFSSSELSQQFSIGGFTFLFFLTETPDVPGFGDF